MGQDYLIFAQDPVLPVLDHSGTRVTPDSWAGREAAFQVFIAWDVDHGPEDHGHAASVRRQQAPSPSSAEATD